MRSGYEGSHFMQLIAHTAHSLVILELLGLNTRGMYTPGSMVITMPGGGGGGGGAGGCSCQSTWCRGCPGPGSAPGDGGTAGLLTSRG